MRSAVVCLLAGVVLVVNPFFACQPREQFHFGERELRAAVEGTWQLTLASRTITFTVRQAAATERHARVGLVRAAAACGHRSFVRSAGACLTDTLMPLELLAIGDDRPALEGSFLVLGHYFEVGQLGMRIDGTSVGAQVASDGSVREVTADVLPVRLVRERR